MKKILYLTVIFIGLITNVYAIEYTQEDIINRIDIASNKMNDLLGDCTTYINNNKEGIKSLIDREFVENFNESNFESSINLVITELRSNGYNNSALELETLKPKLIDNYNYYKETIKITKEYLETHSDSGVTGNLDIFIKIRELFKNNKNKITTLGSKYYNIGFEKVKDNLDKVSFKDAVDKFDYIFELDIVNKIFEESEEYMSLYNSYHLEDYEDVFKDYLRSYYNTLKNDYNELYDILEERYQKSLDNKIQIIVDDTDLTNNESITNRNKKLYDLIDEIDYVSSILTNRFSEINSKISINSIKKYTKSYQEDIIDRLDDASSYVATYIIDNIIVSLKDTKYSNILYVNNDKEYIIYSGTDLSLNIIDKLIANYGNLIGSKLYNGNIGTGSYLYVMSDNLVLKEYLFIVKGDVNPSGKLDISDVVKMANKMFDKTTLNNNEFIAADMNDDNKIDITDIVLLCNKLFG